MPGLLEHAEAGESVGQRSTINVFEAIRVCIGRKPLFLSLVVVEKCLEDSHLFELDGVVNCLLIDSVTGQ